MQSLLTIKIFIQEIRACKQNNSISSQNLKRTNGFSGLLIWYILIIFKMHVGCGVTRAKINAVYNMYCFLEPFRLIHNTMYGIESSKLFLPSTIIPKLSSIVPVETKSYSPFKSKLKIQKMANLTVLNNSKL